MHFAGYHTKVDLATDALADQSKAVAQGAIPKGRGFEPHSCHMRRALALPSLHDGRAAKFPAGHMV